MFKRRIKEKGAVALAQNNLLTRQRFLGIS